MVAGVLGGNIWTEQLFLGETKIFLLNIFAKNVYYNTHEINKVKKFNLFNFGDNESSKFKR